MLECIHLARSAKTIGLYAGILIFLSCSGPFHGHPGIYRIVFLEKVSLLPMSNDSALWSRIICDFNVKVYIAVDINGTQKEGRVSCC